MIALVIVMTVCGVYQSTVDQVFFSEAAGYTGKSILMYGAVFLIFYHAGILSVAVSGSVVTAVLVCAGILLSLCLLTLAQKKRKTERTGRAFVLPSGERAAEILLAFLAGVWLGSYLTDLTGLTDSPSGVPAGAALAAAAGVCSAAAVHLVLEGTAGGMQKACHIAEKIGRCRLCVQPYFLQYWHFRQEHLLSIVISLKMRQYRLGSVLTGWEWTMSNIWMQFTKPVPIPRISR